MHKNLKKNAQKKTFKPSNGTTVAMAATQAGIVVEEKIVDLAPLGDHDVEIRITHSGVCHSDLHTMKGEWGHDYAKAGPIVTGHEILGHVTAVGPKVSTGIQHDWHFTHN